MSNYNKKNNFTDKSFQDERDNDPYALVERAAEILWERSKAALKHGDESRISDESVAKIMTAAVKLYAAKTDGEGRTFRPLLGNYDEIVTPTEALTSVTEVLRSLRLGPMEFGLWSRKRPEDYHDTDYAINKNDDSKKLGET